MVPSFWERFVRALVLESIALATPGAYASEFARANRVWLVRPDDPTTLPFMCPALNLARVAKPAMLPDGGLGATFFSFTSASDVLAGMAPLVVSPLAICPLAILKAEFCTTTSMRVAREIKGAGMDAM